MIGATHFIQLCILLSLKKMVICTLPWKATFNRLFRFHALGTPILLSISMFFKTTRRSNNINIIMTSSTGPFRFLRAITLPVTPLKYQFNGTGNGVQHAITHLRFIVNRISQFWMKTTNQWCGTWTVNLQVRLHFHPIEFQIKMIDFSLIIGVPEAYKMYSWPQQV